ncbi:uncharacterized protein SOCE26_014740 [Sorangium cellulosum]|uniref:Uncharacterized protein n=1 Tax=Sorangium cellulosum TaxID=56 RepID=A0A2L0ELA8_SORCE|nr:uncharacterized protein SOCE26_014740 [Sorangium cellulosum]
MATKEDWAERGKRWERSGLSAEKLARREGYKPKQLYTSKAPRSQGSPRVRSSMAIQRPQRDSNPGSTSRSAEVT